jgi:hypothetical protein
MDYRLQVDVIANHFSTIGYVGAGSDESSTNHTSYLVPIISLIGMAVMPRSKYIQNLISNLVLLCTGAAMALLVGYCSTEARRHSSTVTPQTASQYISSASAVSGFWLFFQVYLSNAARARFPQLQLPVIMYSIFSVVSCTYAPRFPTMTYTIAFVEKLLEAFLTGLAIATAVSFIVIPVTVRNIVFKQFAGYLGLLQKCLKCHQAYLISLEDPSNLEKVMVTERGKGYKPTPEIAALSGTVAAITSLHGKLQGDLPFAKREIAFGKIGPDEMGAISKHIRAVMLPTVGLTAMNDILERLAFVHGWNQKHLDEGLDDEEKRVRSAIVKDWTENIKALHEPFASIISASCDGLEHAALQLQLKKPPKTAKNSAADDVEAKAQGTQPGDPGFAEHLQRKIHEFYSGKREMLQDWCQRHGFDLTPDFFDNTKAANIAFVDWKSNMNEDVHLRNQRQLYLLLYMEFLLYSTAKSILGLVKFSDELVANGTISKTRLLMPGWKRLKKWAKTFLSTQEGPSEEPRGDLGDFDQAAALVDLGSAFSARKDPEHLPPRNISEKIGNVIRAIPRFFRSDASSFGFRVAVATMSIAIIGFLERTQNWFQVHRLVWAIIMVAISMTPTAGQSVFSFVLRTVGTVIAMVVSFLCYYIPDKHTAGVIVFLWLFTSIGMWVPLKRPQMAVVGVIR